MKIEEVIALTQAGFSKTEILAMTQLVPPTQQETPPAQQAAPPAQQATQQATLPAQQATPPTQQEQNDALLNAITNLTNVIQAGNIAATGFQMKQNQNQPKTADQIVDHMMEIMN